MLFNDITSIIKACTHISIFLSISPCPAALLTFNWSNQQLYLMTGHKIYVQKILWMFSNPRVDLFEKEFWSNSAVWIWPICQNFGAKVNWIISTLDSALRPSPKYSLLWISETYLNFKLFYHCIVFVWSQHDRGNVEQRTMAKVPSEILWCQI